MKEEYGPVLLHDLPFRAAGIFLSSFVFSSTEHRRGENMKKMIAVCLLAVLLFAGCRKSDVNENTTTPTTQPVPSETSTASVTEEQTTGIPAETTSETTTEAPVVLPVMNELQRGCFYGANTGTDATYTGLEPLPLSDFGNPPMENLKNLPTETIEHGYGVAKNGVVHDVSVYNQKFFDDNGLKAIAYDNKTTEKVLYLTFDCGYENGYTAKILDTLRDKGVHAAFFCTLPELSGYPEIMTRIINEGHILGNHSVTHPDFSKLSRQQIYEEVKGFDDYLREHYGYSAQYFRYPQGKHSVNSTDMLNAMGYTCVFWSLAYADWDLDNQKGADYAYDTVVSRLHPGAVMLLHAISPDNAGALGRIIDEARRQGYTFRSLSELGQ